MEENDSRGGEDRWGYYVALPGEAVRERAGNERTLGHWLDPVIKVGVLRSSTGRSDVFPSFIRMVFDCSGNEARRTGPRPQPRISPGTIYLSFHCRRKCVTHRLVVS